MQLNHLCRKLSDGKYVKVSEEDIRREMGSCAEEEIRAKTKKKRSGAERTGNPRK